MSVRAYRVNAIEYQERETFNLWHDEKVFEILNDAGYFDSLYEGVGIVYVDVSFIREELLPRIYGEMKETFLRDIEWAERNDQDTIRYFCM